MGKGAGTAFLRGNSYRARAQASPAGVNERKNTWARRTIGLVLDERPCHRLCPPYKAGSTLSRGRTESVPRKFLAKRSHARRCPTPVDARSKPHTFCQNEATAAKTFS